MSEYLQTHTIDLKLKGISSGQTQLIEEKLSASLSFLFEGLGISGKIDLRVTTEVNLSHPFLHIYLNQVYCPFSDEYLCYALAFAQNRPFFGHIYSNIILNRFP